MTEAGTAGAARKLGPLAKDAVERTAKECQDDMRRQLQSGLLILDREGGGGKIQVP